MDINQINLNDAFTYLNYNVEDTIRMGKTAKVQWFFKDLTKDQIAKNEKGQYAIIPGCGCTAKIKVSDKGIVAVYTDNTTKETVSNSSNGVASVSKSIRVFLNDGKPLYETNSKGVLRPNYHGKKNLILTFNVKVKK